MDYLRRIAEQTDTPSYVFSWEDFRDRAGETRGILGENIGLCYSMKANPFLVKKLPDIFTYVEVCSPGELEICIAHKIPPGRILYSGLNKGETDIARALDYGVGLITAESRLHIERINAHADSTGKKARLLVRIAAGSQFGIDRRQVLDILSRRKEWKGIDFIGLHFFTGTQKRKPKEIHRELDFLNRYLDQIKEETGFDPEMIEYGTGCPAYLFGEKEIKTLQQAKEAEIAFLKEIAGSLKELSRKVKLSVEMGRFLAASCGYYITEVVDTKTNDDINYAIVDGGSHQIRLFGQMQGMQPPFISHIPKREAGNASEMTAASGESEWTIAGSLCTTADVLARNIDFTGLAVGDRMVFHQAGAYALYEGMSLFLSRDIPGVYLLDEEGQLTAARPRIDTFQYNGAL